MQTHKAKIIMILVVFLFLFFFSNDFGLIDVEKTSIITAVAVDKADDGNFEVTAQIAVPEATDANTENVKTQLSGKGSTVGGALKDLGDVSGWFPKLAFCNLILIGSSLSDDNVISALDYFAKTLRVQDSALVALAENTAKELLETSTPLDNISSFALQKIMLKNTGFDRDVVSTDVKTFCASHYSLGNSAFMPLIKIVSAGGNTQSGGENSSQSGGQSSSQSKSDKGNSSDKLFNARTTALFLDGKKVGELDENCTLVFNAVTNKIEGTTLPVVAFDEINNKDTNYLLTVMKNRPSVTLKATDNELTLFVNLTLYCKISDHAASNSEHSFSQNKPLPKAVITATQDMINKYLEDMIETTVKTGCDFLKIKQKLYRFNHKQYSRYKDNCLSVFKPTINVKVVGQV